MQMCGETAALQKSEESAYALSERNTRLYTSAHLVKSRYVKSWKHQTKPENVYYETFTLL